MKLLSPKTDIVFKKLFGSIGNEEITRKFISLIIGKEIEKISLDTNTVLNGENTNEKIGILDVRAKLPNGTDFNIEMQIEDYKDMPERMLYYWSRLYGRKLEKGETYKKLTPTISILISNYNLDITKELKEYHTSYNIIENTYHNIILTNDLQIHIIELQKIKDEDLKTELGTWLMFLKNPESKGVKNTMFESAALKQAIKELEYLSGDPNFQSIVEAREKAILDENSLREQSHDEGFASGHERGMKAGLKEGEKRGREQGLKEGIEQGVTEGEKKAKLEIAKEMLKQKMRIEDISKITKLAIEEIKKISV